MGEARPSGRVGKVGIMNGDGDDGRLHRYLYSWVVFGSHAF